eukprot:10058816-Lingulodinium_polyedra.AAC.1
MVVTERRALGMHTTAQRSHAWPSRRAPCAAEESQAPRYLPPAQTTLGPKGLCNIAARQFVKTLLQDGIVNAAM